MSWILGLAVMSATLALIPSKKEQEWPVPWCSIVLAALAGLFVGLSGINIH